ncbi:PREDICTED: translocating chain-associated membrane protein 1 [Diuraphis noxia]|uniref:translocating chain-associated membrane protein 1 n=1 Tax=Diuraphis noxia TaxID=143948 RepID=UPI0007637490|nr:PREDICTED: translocating chain-associated membrane protein 1 [Diuraphis noxia]
MAPIKGRKSATNKNLPILSHEFVIQNHADIMSCVAMVIVIGLMVQLTSPVSSLFVALQYVQASRPDSLQTYGTGLKDLFTIFFYFLICIIFHAIIQEYVLDKISRKLHLSKSKNSKFNESGQLIVFNAVSMIWALDIVVKGNWLADFSSLWIGYPYHTLSFSTKFFYIIQFAYWAHIMPELYFQKIKKEDMFSRVKYSVLYLTFISAIYITNFHRIGVVLLLLNYICGFTKHAVKLIDITEKEEDSKKVQLAQNVYNWLFYTVQSLTLILSQTMLWFGLKSVQFSGELRDFNTPVFKLICSISALAAQAWLLHEFLNDQNSNGLNLSASFGLIKPKPKTKTDGSNKKRKNTVSRKFNELTEADQNTKKTLKHEAKKAAKITKSVK